MDEKWSSDLVKYVAGEHTVRPGTSICNRVRKIYIAKNYE